MTLRAVLQKDFSEFLCLLLVGQSWAQKAQTLRLY